MEDSKCDVMMDLYARKLDKKDFFGKVSYDSYVILLRIPDLIMWVGVWHSCLVMWSLGFIGNNVYGCMMS